MRTHHRIVSALVCTLLLGGAAAAQVRVEFRTVDGVPTLFAGGQPVASIVPYRADGFETADEVREVRPGLFEWTRTFTYNGGDFVRPARLTMEVSARYKSLYSLIPAVMYDGNEWGTGLEPKGFVTDGGPWVFAFHRTSVPGATYSESDKWSVGLFSSPGQLPGGFSCFLEPREDRTIHGLVWPEEETPRVYAYRDLYQEAYREDLRVSQGQVIALKAWIVAGPVEAPKHGWHAMLDEAWALNARPVSPRWDPEILWDLGMEFAKGSLWAEEKNFRGFSIGLRWDGAKWIQRQTRKYEIGWAGQNASLANSLLADFLKTGDKDSLEKGVACLDAWVRHARLRNGLIRGQFDIILGLGDPRSEVQDACNLGNAAQNLFEAFELAAKCGLKKPEYRAAALGVVDFALKAMRSDGRIGKAWTNDGRAVDPDGTIGAFLVPPLVAAYRMTREKKYLDGAERAFSFYLGEFRRDGFTTAGALDTHCIDKESATPLLKAALALYDITDRDVYLRAAEDVSYYIATWQWHYTVPYAKGTVLREMGYDTFGGTAVSTQHHHLDPFALVIVNDWLELARLTKNPAWRERALAAWANGSIGISDGDLVIMGKKRPAGSQDEGFLQTRWYHPFSVSQWLVAWPTAFRLETLRATPNWLPFYKD